MPTSRSREPRSQKDRRRRETRHGALVSSLQRGEGRPQGAVNVQEAQGVQASRGGHCERCGDVLPLPFCERNGLTVVRSWRMVGAHTGGLDE